MLIMSDAADGRIDALGTGSRRAEAYKLPFEGSGSPVESEMVVFLVIITTGLKSSFVARLARCAAKRGKRAKKPAAYPLRYSEDFFVKCDEVAVRISSTAAEDTFEISSISLSAFQ